jgi:excinuclease ABC subunit A
MEREGDVDLDEVGKDARMPWQVDGRRWHTIERVSRSGKPCRWEGQALAWLVDRVQELGQFGETRWNDRTIVEIAAKVKSQGWFLHASTGEEWFLWLTFRVGKNTFKPEALRSHLGLLPPDETPGLETYGTFPRVRVKNQKGGAWQSVEVAVHWLHEIDTPAFAQFLKKAVASFNANLNRMQTRPEDVMPWKINGERWHLGDWANKGFPPGKKPVWDLGVLRKVLEVLQQAVPEVELDWNLRDAIHFKLHGKTWGRIKTKEVAAVDCHVLARKGQFNLARLEGLAWHRELLTHRPEQDILRLAFRGVEQIRADAFQAILKEAAAGFG